MTTRTNWAGNHRIVGDRLLEPRSLDELQAIVRGTPSLRVLGTGHTFNDLPDSRGDLVSLTAMPRRFEVDEVTGTVAIDTATRYGDLGEPLHAAGFALEAMASLGHISAGGAVATGTHGSGDAVPSLAANVVGMELVSPSGELVAVADASGRAFAGLVVGLGAFGVVTSLTLRVVPTYELRQDVFEDVPLHLVVDRFDEVTAMGHSVSLFTIWRDRAFHQLWCKRRPAVQTPAYAAIAPRLRPATRPLHPIPGLDPVACTTQLGVPGPWHERLPHFRLEHTPSSGHELQSEFLVDRRHAPAALEALFDAAPRFRSAVQVSEIRTVAADELWLSPAAGRESVAIHCTWVPDAAVVHEALAVVEATLAPFDPRPHWGKLWSLPVDQVRASYPRYRDAVALRDRWDPDRRFANRAVDALLGD